MADIKYNEEELKIHSESLVLCYSQIESLSDSISRKLATVENYWQGNSFEEFRNLIEKTKVIKTESLNKFMNSINKMEQITGIYTTASSDVKKKNEALPIEGVFLE